MILCQMAKRNKGRGRQNKKHATKQPLMTEGMVAEVKVWLERMRDQAGRAVSLSERLSPSDMDESNDLFWALAKYAENVQESIVKLDDINKRIYPELIELNGDTWQGLKGMRSRLAHAFWNIDPQILWSTVTRDFPDLLALVSTMIVIDRPIGEQEPFEVILKTERLLSLPDVTPESMVEAGHSIVVMVLGYDGRVGVFRIGHDGTKRLAINANFDTQFTVYGRRRR